VSEHGEGRARVGEALGGVCELLHELGLVASDWRRVWLQGH
jgi:hypothetical protein